MTNKLLLILIMESGQFRVAMDTQARAVIVPMPWEIIKAGGTIIDKGLSPDPKIFFINWTINRSEIIKRICLELMFGLSFIETSINNPQLNMTSRKVAPQDKKSETPKTGTRSIL